MTTRARKIKTSAIAGTLLFMLALIYALASSQSMANDKVQREHQFEGASTTRLVINNAVGSIVLEPSSDNNIHVSVAIEGKRHGLLRRKFDVSEVDIESSLGAGDNELRLALTEDNVQGDWVVAIPDLSAVEISQGVGSVEVTEVNAALALEVGVGSIKLVLHSDAVGEFSADIGVGGITQHGLHSYSSRRAVVTESGTGRGAGQYAVSAEVGVGDVDIRLRD